MLCLKLDLQYNVRIQIKTFNEYLFKYSLQVWMSVESFITVNISQHKWLFCVRLDQGKGLCTIRSAAHTAAKKLNNTVSVRPYGNVLQRLSYQAKRGTLTDSGPTDSWDSASSSCSWRACCTPARSAPGTRWSSSRSAEKGEKRKDRRVVNRSFTFKINQGTVLFVTMMQVTTICNATVEEQYVLSLDSNTILK